MTTFDTRGEICGRPWRLTILAMLATGSWLVPPAAAAARGPVYGVTAGWARSQEDRAGEGFLIAASIGDDWGIELSYARMAARLAEGALETFYVGLATRPFRPAVGPRPYLVLGAAVGAVNQEYDYGSAGVMRDDFWAPIGVVGAGSRLWRDSSTQMDLEGRWSVAPSIIGGTPVAWGTLGVRVAFSR